jgi:prepilin-type N-terminal cleavage/methylation domain-containing protein
MHRPMGINSTDGFSLLELLFVMVIFAILTAIARPDLDAMSPSIARADAIKQVSFDLQRAKNEALAEGVRSILSVSGDGKSYSIGIDYLPYNDPPSADEVTLGEQLPANVTMGASQTVIFDSRGFLIDDAGAGTTASVNLSLKDAQFCTFDISAAGVLNVQTSN